MQFSSDPLSPTRAAGPYSDAELVTALKSDGKGMTPGLTVGASQRPGAPAFRPGDNHTRARMHHFAASPALSRF